MRARHRLPIGLAAVACLAAGFLTLALLLLIDALDTGQAVVADRSLARVEAPALFWSYTALLALGGLGAIAVLAAALLALATDTNVRRRTARPRRPRPPKSP